ncbi:MAG: hypothetical protein J5884_00985 [Paludibacteraceae bacterium]|nr:hypothetical protein [Paludibacteraceae bacterium]
MKPKLCIISLIGILFLSLTACGGIHLDGAYDFRWVLYIKSNDSLLVEYPCDAPYKNEHPVTADKEVRWKTLEVYKDTFQRGANWIHDRNLTNVEVHVYRQTSNEDVRILFCQKAITYDMFNPDGFPIYHILDSLMDVYGVTMPANQSALILPVTSIWSK